MWQLRSYHINRGVTFSGNGLSVAPMESDKDFFCEFMKLHQEA